MSQPLVTAPYNRSTGLTPVADAPTPPSLPSVVQYLIENLGFKLTAYIASGHKTELQQWLDDASKPAREKEVKLRAAFSIFQTVQAVESPHTVRAWFIGTNPQLGQLSPAEAIATGRLTEAMAAARAFVTGG